MDEELRLWLDMSDFEIAHGRMAEWRYDRQLIVEEHERGFQRRYSFPAQGALDHLIKADPQRALNIAFIIARGAENDGDFIALGVGPLTDLVRADPALWNTVEVEAEANPKLLRAVAQVFETTVPDRLQDACVRFAGEHS